MRGTPRAGVGNSAQRINGFYMFFLQICFLDFIKEKRFFFLKSDALWGRNASVHFIGSVNVHDVTDPH